MPVLLVKRKLDPCQGGNSNENRQNGLDKVITGRLLPRIAVACIEQSGFARGGI